MNNIKEAFCDDMRRNDYEKCFHIMLIFADWCEDNYEEDLAKCLRWMSKNKKRPMDGRWYNEEDNFWSFLPNNIFKSLTIYNSTTSIGNAMQVIY